LKIDFSISNPRSWNRFPIGSLG